ncbi:uncharacterized protein LOC143348781 [Colletes latitarsis]|uniref:uncharacterized protein LOC143348781 n=1 Tax=Colletes latitarsis TaxID=2605962 RepID=UPI004035F76C
MSELVVPEVWTLFKLHEFCKNKETLFKFLQDKKLIAKNLNCPQCGNTMKLVNENWRCRRTIPASANAGKRKRICDIKISVKRGTWFSKTKLSYEIVLKLTYMLVHNFEQYHIIRELELNKNTVSQWNYFMKQVMADWLQNSCEILGGPDKVVEIDESKFGRRKYHRGHRVEGQWVFGGVERESGKVFLVPVESRDTESLLSVIKQWVLPGTTIISDCWKAYNILEKEGYKHLTVNHSLHFKDPETGVHTNTIETTWRHTKKIISSDI